MSGGLTRVFVPKPDRVAGPHRIGFVGRYMTASVREDHAIALVRLVVHQGLRRSDHEVTLTTGADQHVARKSGWQASAQIIPGDSVPPRNHLFPESKRVRRLQSRRHPARARKGGAMIEDRLQLRWPVLLGDGVNRVIPGESVNVGPDP